MQTTCIVVEIESGLDECYCDSIIKPREIRSRKGTRYDCIAADADISTGSCSE